MKSANGKLESTSRLRQPKSPFHATSPQWCTGLAYPDYAPYYFPPPPGYNAGGVLAIRMAFAAGVAVRYAFWGNCDWGRGNVVTN